ncbi:MAG: hypothetical protein ACKVGZ_20285 [Alphaproteobacteria bacterium]|jgi:hypothetical protein
MEFVVDVGRYLAFAALIILPGIWIGYSRLCTGMDGWLRLLLAISLSPMIGSMQYTVLRAAGMGLDPAVFATALINIPAIWFALRQATPYPLLKPRGLVIASISVAIRRWCMEANERKFPLPS